MDYTACPTERNPPPGHGCPSPSPKSSRPPQTSPDEPKPHATENSPWPLESGSHSLWDQRSFSCTRRRGLTRRGTNTTSNSCRIPPRKLQHSPKPTPPPSSRTSRESSDRGSLRSRVLSAPPSLVPLRREGGHIPKKRGASGSATRRSSHWGSCSLNSR